ncbi:MAG: hypothetical protein HGA87_00280 [Desulfobulbaceae bacterium]|nr:hypothetical protein [Desulfobulbaceae bacterium]
MVTIPLVAEPAQTLNVILGGQNCEISVYQKTTGMFIDLQANGEPVLNARICRNMVNLVTQPYLPFVGTLFFSDSKGTDDPDYTGLGSRFFLIYSFAGE